MFINSWKNKLNSIECFTYTTLHLSTELFVFTFSFYVNQLPKPTKCLVMTSRRVRIHSVISKLYYILGIKWFLHPWYKQSHTSLPHPPIIPFISPLIIPFIIPFRNTFAFFIRITSDVILFFCAFSDQVGNLTLVYFFQLAKSLYHRSSWGVKICCRRPKPFQSSDDICAVIPKK